MARRSVVFALSTVAVVASMAMPAHAQDAIIRVHLTGAAEAPGPGDPDASGNATIYIDDDTNKLCLSLSWSNVDGTPSGLHIHFAPPGAAGPVVIPFAVPTGTVTFQCVAVANEDLLDNISVHPEQYYINIHSNLYPAGAARGQLG